MTINRDTFYKTLIHCIKHNKSKYYFYYLNNFRDTGLERYHISDLFFHLIHYKRLEYFIYFYKINSNGYLDDENLLKICIQNNNEEIFNWVLNNSWDIFLDFKTILHFVFAFNKLSFVKYFPPNFIIKQNYMNYSKVISENKFITLKRNAKIKKIL
jgi:hypothetical protein